MMPLGSSVKTWLRAAVATGVAGAALYVVASKAPRWLSSTAAVVHCSSSASAKALQKGVVLDHSASVIARVMLPDDANPAGNVHGGTILHMIDEAGWATATRFFNQAQSDVTGIAGLARIEHVDFLRPMFIGELARISAEVTYTSERSIEVTVHVYAENAITDTTRLTNKARLWYIIKEVKDHRDLYDQSRRTVLSSAKCLPVPQLKFDESAASEGDDERREVLGNLRYEYQRQQRVARTEVNELHPTTDSYATLIHVLLPSDCYANGTAQAGTVLKLMDTAAGVISVKHCHTNVVTASLEAVDFLQPVYNGNLIELHSTPIFCSNRSMDVEVDVYAIDPRTNEKHLAAQSVFTFVSLDSKGRPQQIPPLTIDTPAKEARHKLRQDRYLQRKEERRLEKEKLAKKLALKQQQEQQQEQ